MQTKAYRSSPKSRSIKTTIPISLVDIMKIKEGDTLNWEFETRGEKIVAILSK